MSPTDRSKRVVKIYIEKERLGIHFEDKSFTWVPYFQVPKIRRATSSQRLNYVIAQQGRSVYWPELDQELSVEAFYPKGAVELRTLGRGGRQGEKLKAG